jgi:hypothetical protein
MLALAYSGLFEIREEQHSKDSIRSNTEISKEKRGNIFLPGFFHHVSDLLL